MNSPNSILTVETLFGPVIVFCVAMLFFLWQLLKWRSFRNHIHVIALELKGFPNTRGSLSIGDFSRLSQILSKSKMLEHEWFEFSETIVEHEVENTVFNTINLSQFINIESFLDRHYDASLHRKGPTIITSIGLLFTFVFIVLGLGGLNFADSGTLQTSIQSLVSNLAGKFLSSVSGILFAIFLTGTEHIFYGSSRKTIESLLHRVDHLLSRRPQESYLLDLRSTLSEAFAKQTLALQGGLAEVVDAIRDVERNTGDLRVAMSQFGTDLSTAIKNSIEQEVSRPLQAALQALQQEKSQSQTELLREALNQFKSSLSETAGSEFTALGTTVAEMSQVLRASSTQSTEVTKQVERLLEAVASQTERSRESSDQQLHKVQSSIAKVVEDLAGKMNAVADASAAAFAGQSNTVHAQISELASVVGGVNAAITDITTRLDEANQQTISRLGTVTSAISQSSADLTDRQNKMTQGIAGLNDALTETLSKYKATLMDQEKILNGHRDVAKHQSDAQVNFQQAQALVISTLKQVSARDAEFRETHERSQAIIEKFKEVFSGVESGLGKILSQLSTNIEHYNQATTSTLSSALDRYDTALTTSTGRLQSSVEGLSEVLESIEEVFAAAKKKAG